MPGRKSLGGASGPVATKRYTLTSKARRWLAREDARRAAVALLEQIEEAAASPVAFSAARLQALALRAGRPAPRLTPRPFVEPTGPAFDRVPTRLRTGA